MQEFLALISNALLVLVRGIPVAVLVYLGDKAVGEWLPHRTIPQATAYFFGCLIAAPSLYWSRYAVVYSILSRKHESMLIRK